MAEGKPKKRNYWMYGFIISSLFTIVMALSHVVYSAGKEDIYDCKATAERALDKATKNCQEIEVAKASIKVEMGDVKRRLDKLESLQYEILREIRKR